MKYFKPFNVINDDLQNKLNEKFWGNSASGILPIAKDTGRILIGLRSDDVNEPNTWGNFGGAIGLNDYGIEDEKLTPEENAKKEMVEEIDYKGNIELIKSYIYKSNNFIYYNYIGLIDKEFDVNNMRLNWEVDELKWVTYDELIEHEDLHFGITSLLDNTGEQIYTLCKKYTNII